MDDWQPIETAPKDGTPILIARDMGTWGWVIGWATWMGKPEAFLSGWVPRGFTEMPGVLGLANPSHWQPLPEPPTA